MGHIAQALPVSQDGLGVLELAVRGEYELLVKRTAEGAVIDGWAGSVYGSESEQNLIGTGTFCGMRARFHDKIM